MEGSKNERVIVPLTKSPHSHGRIGPRKWQDWRRGLKKAKRLRDEIGGRILVLSDLHVTGQEAEANTYYRELRYLGAYQDDILVVRKARETIGQIEVVKEMVRENNDDITVISTFLHYLRVRWLCRGLGWKHKIVFGIPRPYEAVTDLILIFALPIIDMLGQREWFVKWTAERRATGTF